MWEDGMRDRSLPGDPRFSASAPGSEATSQRFADQQKPERSLSASTDETPAEHIRNALQMLDVGEQVTPALVDVAAVRRRLRLALEGLEWPRVVTGQALSQYMAELAAARSAVDVSEFEIPVSLSRDFALDSSRGAGSGRSTPRDERTLTRAVELERRGFSGPRRQTWAMALAALASLAGVAFARLEGWL